MGSLAETKSIPQGARTAISAKLFNILEQSCRACSNSGLAESIGQRFRISELKDADRIPKMQGLAERILNEATRGIPDEGGGSQFAAALLKSFVSGLGTH